MQDLSSHLQTSSLKRATPDWKKKWKENKRIVQFALLKFQRNANETAESQSKMTPLLHRSQRDNIEDIITDDHGKAIPKQKLDIEKFPCKTIENVVNFKLSEDTLKKRNENVKHCLPISTHANRGENSESSYKPPRYFDKDVIDELSINIDSKEEAKDYSICPLIFQFYSSFKI